MTHQYDLFVSYAIEDRSWVQENLLSAFDAGDVNYLTEATFQIGVPWIMEFERAVRQSKRTLLVLSPHYLNAYFNQYVDILVNSYGLETGSWPVIPMIIQPVTLPTRLSQLVTLEATEPSEWQQTLKRLFATLNLPVPTIEDRGLSASANLQAIHQYKNAIQDETRQDILFKFSLDELYIPLKGQGPPEKNPKQEGSTLQDDKDLPQESPPAQFEVVTGTQPNQDNKETFIVPLPLDLHEAVGKHPRLVIVGTAGTGKSTFLRHLAYQKAKDESISIPILVPLSKFAVELNRYDKVADKTEKLAQKLAINIASPIQARRDALKKEIEAGNVLWLLDGFDEAIKKAHDPEELTKLIAGMVDSQDFVLTTRADEAKQHLNKFSHATQYEMRDLSPKDVEEFLKKWFDDPNKASGVQGEVANRLHMQAVVKKPLHLVMLATIRKENSEEKFPDTRVQLYKKFMDFYLNKRIEEKKDAKGFFQLGSLKRDDARTAVVQGFNYLGWVLFHQEKKLSNDSPTTEKQVVDSLKRDGFSEQDAEEILLFWQEAGIQKSLHLSFWPYAVACKLYEDWKKNADNTWQFLSSATPELPYASRLHHPDWKEPILILAALMDESQVNNLTGRLLGKPDKEESYLHQNLRLAAEILGEVGAGKLKPEHEKQIINQLGRLSQSYNWKRAFVQFFVGAAMVVPLCLLLPLWASGGILFLWIYGSLPYLRENELLDNVLRKLEAGYGLLHNDHAFTSDLFHISGSLGIGVMTFLRLIISPIIIVLSLPIYIYGQRHKQIALLAGCALLLFIALAYKLLPQWVLGFFISFWLLDVVFYWLLDHSSTSFSLRLLTKTKGIGMGRIHKYISTMLINLFRVTATNTVVFLEALAQIGPPAVPQIKRLLKANSLDVSYTTATLSSEAENILTQCLFEDTPVGGQVSSQKLSIEAIKQVRDKTILEPLLEDEIWSVRYAAAITLCRMGELSAIPYLVNLASEANLDETLTEIRDGLASIGKTDISALEKYLYSPIVIKALGVSGNPDAIPILNNLLLTHQDIDIRRRAARALGNYGKDAVSVLIDALAQCDDYQVRFSIVEGLGQTGSTAIIPILLNSLNRDHFWWERRAAAEALKHIHDATVIELLIDSIQKDEHSSVRDVVAEILGQLGDEDIAKRLTEILEASQKKRSEIAKLVLERVHTYHDIQQVMGDKEVVLQIVYDEAIIKALGEIGEEVAVPALIWAASEDNEEIREIIRKAFGGFGLGVEYPALEKIFWGDSQRRNEAVDALGKIGNRQAIEPLIRIIQTSRGDLENLHYLYENACLALAKIDNDPAAPYLIEALENSYSDETRKKIKEFLKQVDPARSVPQLITLLASDDWHAYTLAEEILPDLGNQAVKSLCDVYRTNSNTKVQSRIVEILGRIGDQSATPLLFEALKNRDKSVSRAAVQALAKIGRIGDENFKKLIEVFHDKQKSYLFAEIAVALGQLAGSISDDNILQVARKALWQRRFAHYKEQVFVAYGQVITQLTILQVRKLS